MQDSASLLVWARVGVCDLGITGFHYNTLANSLLPPKARASEDSVRKWAFAFWNGECGVRMRLNVLRGSLLAIPFHCGNKFLLGLGTLTAAGRVCPFVELFSIIRVGPMEPFSSSSLNYCAILDATFPIGGAVLSAEYHLYDMSLHYPRILPPRSNRGCLASPPRLNPASKWWLGSWFCSLKCSHQWTLPESAKSGYNDHHTICSSLRINFMESVFDQILSILNINIDFPWAVVSVGDFLGT